MGTITNDFTNAEIQAKIACELSEFSNLNLLGVKSKVSDILALIGKVEGIFSTYTKHDISHINAMLRILDWLIPPSTKEAMTPTDWLMIVLAIYFHDLGMVVTSEEYQLRMTNEEFTKFLSDIYEDTENKDYLARAEGMEAEEKNRFFYQEFVRKNHASRIREWITGKHSRHWGNTVKSITAEIAKIMENLPLRFRNDLALVCESHHKEDLDNTDLYKLTQKYGSQPELIANIQYAAFLLRTADLIHVTKDRTPSVMYKIINFSDLKSVEEWDKQRGAFAVYMKGREYIASETDSHIIEISADFTEEPPFFALTEYIAWADGQIKQTKQWADRSKQINEGKKFIFPWHTLTGDIRVEGNEPRPMRFELDRGRLLNLLVGHTIYNDATVALRELLQNAIDAVRFQYYTEMKMWDNEKSIQPKLGKVHVKWNPETRELIVQDNGTGMDLDIIQNHLLRVGSSFYDTSKFQTGYKDFTPISKFGIGILTCFMISDNIEIITCRNYEGRRIRMTSVHADYLLKDLMNGDQLLEGIEPHGTKISLKIRPSVRLKNNTIIDILNYWLVLPPCDIIYSQMGIEDQKIGFKNIKDALKTLYSEDIKNSIDDSYEIVSFNLPFDDNGNYELAFIVKQGFMPGRNFVSLDNIEAKGNLNSSLVYIEGIRVDSNIPGFQSRLPGLLAVSNNKKFRTTVSRSSLEKDEEYNKMAISCINIFYKHINKEVEFISNQLGKPLSQASSVGRRLYNTIKRHTDYSFYDIGVELYKKIPTIVVEQFVGEQKDSKRDLITLDKVNGMKEFWAIESRAVDYLGIISRDLGRELNVVSFIDTYLLSDNNTSINPLIIDAHQYIDELYDTHTISEIEFSKKNQRTVVKWQKKENDLIEDLYITSEDLRSFVLGKFYEYGITDQRNSYSSRSILAQFNTEDKDLIDINFPLAKLSGDIPEIIGVKSRMGVIISKDSFLSASLTALQQCINKTLVAKSDDIYQLHFARIIIYLLCIKASNPRNESYMSEKATAPQLKTIWREIFLKINTLLKKNEIPYMFSDNLDELIGDKENWFNASRYWLDWDDF